MFRLLMLLNARFAHQRGRSLFSVLGIALGVALGFAVHLVNRAAVDELTAAVRAVGGGADLQVLGDRAGFDESIYARVARVEGVALASPRLELVAGGGAGGPDRRVRVVGLDALRAAGIQPALFAGDPATRYALLEPDTVMLSAAAAREFGVAAGGQLGLVVGLGRVVLKVIGVLPADALPGVAVLADVATVQWRLDRLGRLTGIDLRLAPRVAPETVRARLEAMLPEGLRVVAPDEAAGGATNPSRAYRVNLNVLALVALFTGGFLVFSAQSLEVARRRGEHALLRVLGLDGAGVARLVLLEATAIGVVGSAVGIALGVGLAVLALQASGGDLGAGMFRGIAPRVAFAPIAAAAYFALGVAIALAGAWLPARDAAQRPPARALRAGDDQSMFAGLVRSGPGLTLIVAGAACTGAGPVGGIPVFGYLAIACLLLGSIALMPRLADALLARVPLPRLPAAALAVAQLRGAPGQAMVSLAAIVASFSLMVAMAIMVSSFRTSVSDWLDTVLPADVYFRVGYGSDTAYVDAAFAAQVRALAPVARVEFTRSTRLALAGSPTELTLLARDMPGAREGRVFPRVGAGVSRGEGDPPPVWVSEALAEREGTVPGSRIALPIGGRSAEFLVVGVWRDYARQHGAVLMRRDDYVALTGDARVNDAAVWLRAGATAAEAMAALRALPGGGELDIAVPGEIRAVSLRLFDRSFAVTYAIEAVAVLVGLFGLSSSLAAIVLARRREFGMLRHLGMTRGQIGTMLALEGGLLASIGAAVGWMVGAAIGLVLVHVVNRQSFHWSMDLHPPYALLAMLTVVLVTAAALTGWWSGREATGMGPVRAVREDW